MKIQSCGVDKLRSQILAPALELIGVRAEVSYKVKNSAPADLEQSCMFFFGADSEAALGQGRFRSRNFSVKLEPASQRLSAPAPSKFSSGKNGLPRNS